MLAAEGLCLWVVCCLKHLLSFSVGGVLFKTLTVLKNFCTYFWIVVLFYYFKTTSLDIDNWTSFVHPQWILFLYTISYIIYHTISYHI
jgi:hypothetical protein